MRNADFGETVAITPFMKQFLVILLTILTTLNSVWANLGDGDDKIEDSYGQIIERHLLDDGAVSVLYHKDRYLYFVIFARQGYRSFRKRDRKIPKGECRRRDVDAERQEEGRTSIRAERSQGRGNVHEYGWSLDADGAGI